jgi:hypothetical protein
MAKAVQFEVFFQDRSLGKVGISRTGKINADDDSLVDLVESVADTNGISSKQALQRLDELMPAGHRTWAKRL